MERIKIRPEPLGCMSLRVKKMAKHKKKMSDTSLCYEYTPREERPSHRQTPINSNTSQSPRQHSRTEDEKARITSPVKTHHAQERVLQGLTIYQVTIHKIASGYGFTVKNTSPVRVGRVKPGGAAEQSGLRKGDFVMRINGQNVQQMTAQNVARIVRHSTKFLEVEFCRKPSRTSPCDKCQDEPILERAHIYDSISENDSGVMQSLSRSSLEIPGGDFVSDNDENIPPLHRASLSTSTKSRAEFLRSSQCGSHSINSVDRNHVDFIKEPKGSESHISRAKDTKCSTPNHSSTRSVRHVRTSKSYSKWDPDISVISTAESLKGRQVISFCDMDLPEASSSKIGFGESGRNRHVETPQPSIPWQHQPVHSNQDLDLASYHTNQGFEAPHCSLAEPAISCHDSASRGFANATSSPVVTRQAAITHLLHCEADFIQMMQLGIQQFSRPLRHCVLTTQQHAQLFQNVEKLVTLSEYHLHQLRIAQTLEGLDLLGEVYKPRIKLLCSAYKSYLEGLPVAFSLLFELKEHHPFATFIQKQQMSDMTIDNFLRRPLLHLETLKQTMSAVLMHTPEFHEDRSSLMEIINALMEDCPTSAQPVENAEEFTTTYQEASLTSRDSAYSLSSHGDSRVLDLQDRLSFSKGIKPFQLVDPPRHLIFGGDLSMFHAGSWINVQASLLSDMLLLTTVTNDDRLQVFKQPISLLDVLNLDSLDPTTTDFTVTIEKVKNDQSVRCYAERLHFRGSSVEEKFAWKSVIEHRVQILKRQANCKQHVL